MIKQTWTLALLMLFSGMVTAQERSLGEALARSNRCFNCHSIDQKIVGPSFRQIARKYAARQGQDPDLERKLAAVIRYGASHGGSLAMPSYRQLNDGTLDVIIRWILSTDERSMAAQ